MGKDISLVLGSGGARGLAHIGVIHWLNENGFKIKSISGCSMGALIGGIYAAGKLDDFEHWVRAITKVEILKLLDLSWGMSGLVKGDRIINTLTALVGDQKIEDLPITYTAVAADIVSEKEVWINEGPLFDAIRASISLPLFFTPFKHNGIDLIDGGVLNPVPIAPTFSDSTDLTIAVNLGGMVEAKDKIEIINKQKSDETSAFPEQFSGPFTEAVTEYVGRLTDSIAGGVNQDWDAYDIANQAFDAMQSTIARQKLAAYPADVNIEIARNACGTLEFDRASEMIDLGYAKAQESLGLLLN